MFLYLNGEQIGLGWSYLHYRCVMFFVCERSIKMNISRAALLIALLLSVAILAGCQEGHARRSSTTIDRQVVLVPSQTGFWQAQVVSPGSR